VKQKQKIIVLALLLPVLLASAKYASLHPKFKTSHSNILIFTSDTTNYSIGVFPNEEYTWIITVVREKNLELAFGSNWTDVFGLGDISQRGNKFKVNTTSTQSNGTHLLLDFEMWDCIYRSNNFSIIPDRSCRYEYPVYPQNYTSTIEFDCVFPLFLPTPLVPYIYGSNLSDTYYTAEDFTSYGGDLYVYYDRQVNISGSVITLDGVACYLENGVLDYFRFYYINGSDQVECLSIESFEPYHLEQTSLGFEVGEEFTWVLVNYNLTALENFFGEEFFEKFGLLPDPERMQSIKLKVDGTAENDTSLGVDYSMSDWTFMEDNFSDSSAKNGSYSFLKEPFNETRSTSDQIPFLIPQPTELFLRYGRFGDNFQFLFDFNSYLYFHFGEGDEWFYGRIYYNTAGVLTSMIFTRRFYEGGQTVEQVAFEIALYYDTATPDYVGIEEGVEFNYDIYTNESIEPNMAFSTKHFDNAKIEVVKIFGEEVVSGRTMVIANFSLKKDTGTWEIADLYLVGYVYSDSCMYFDPLVPTNVNPFFLAPLFVNNKMNWSEFALSYSNYSGIQSLPYYSVSEMEDGYKFHYQDFVKNVTFSYTYNKTGFLSEYTIYVNEALHHNCTLDEIIDPPIEIDTDPPVIAVITPSLEDLFGVSPMEYDLTVGDAHLNCTWLTLSEGLVECVQDFSFASGDSVVEISGDISEIMWALFTDGNITVRFYANDSSGNLDWEEITVIKDATAPTISILNIIPNQEFNDTSPEFELAITEIHLNSTWYTVNGSESVHFTGSSGVIDQTIWGSLSNGSVLVQFFALDETGNLGTSEVVVVKIIKSESPSPVESDDPTIPGITMALIAFQIIFSIVSLLICAKLRKQTRFN